MHPIADSPDSVRRLGRRRTWAGVSLALAAIVFVPGIFFAWTGGSEWIGLWVIRALVVAALALTGVAGLILMPFRVAVAERLLLFGVLGVASAVVFAFCGRFAQDAALRACAERAEPLVAAIERFWREHGEAPQELGDLVPGFLPAVPGTGLPRAPRFVYERAPDYARHDPAIPWELRVEWAAPLMQICVLFHRPVGAGRERFFGRPARPIGGWYYVEYD